MVPVGVLLLIVGALISYVNVKLLDHACLLVESLQSTPQVISASAISCSSSNLFIPAVRFETLPRSLVMFDWLAWKVPPILVYKSQTALAWDISSTLNVKLMVALVVWLLFPGSYNVIIGAVLSIVTLSACEKAAVSLLAVAFIV